MIIDDYLPKKGFTTFMRTERGFTLIELLVAVSIIAILSTIGISNYQGVQSKVRDDVRKQDLSKLTTALELYLDSNNSYIAGTGSCDQDSPLFYSQITPYFTSDQGVPKDPLTKGDYCYLSVNSGQSYYLCAKLENCSDPDIQLTQEQCASAQYNYALASEDLTRSQSYAPCLPVPSPTPSPTPVPTSTPTAMATAKPTPTPQPTPTPIPTSTPFTPPPQICSTIQYVSDTQYPYTDGVYDYDDSITVTPVPVSWTGIGKIEIYQYQHPQPLSPPFYDQYWPLIGTVTRTPIYQCLATYESCSGEPEECTTECSQYSTNIIGYAYSPSNQQITWRAPGYAGDYYLGMVVYDESGKKIASWNVGNATGCTKKFPVQAPKQICQAGESVYPYNLKTSVSGNNVLLQWHVANSNSPNDNSSAYISQQPGFTADPSKRVVSRLNAGSGSAIDATDVRTPAFYKVSAFNSAGISPASDSQGYITGIGYRSGTDYSGPPGAENLTISFGPALTWEYWCCIGISFQGWRAVRSDGLIFDIPRSETSDIQARTWYRRATWTMPTAVAGTYYIQAYDFINNDTSVTFGGQSNTATLTSGSSASSAPGTAPSVVTATSGDRHPITISWTDTTSNEFGFHIYRSLEPLDLTKSTLSTNMSSSYQWAYFPSLATGKHHFAVKTSNNCGTGWSNYVTVEIPPAAVQGVTSTLWSTIKTFIQKFLPH